MFKRSLTIILIMLGFVFMSFTAEASTPVVFFSDATDGPITGWNGSATKGAAVTIWGLNFGTSGSVTCGGQTLSSSNNNQVAEWAATTNPTTARSLQRITFYLNSSMSTGATTILVTTSGGTSGTIPFYCRALDSNHIYFVSPTGSDSANGYTTSTPWLTTSKARSTLIAGDCIYFRTGTYAASDVSSGSAVKFSNNHNNGSSNKSILWTAYPGEIAQLGDATLTNAIKVQGTGEQFHYYTFSKFILRSANTGNTISWATNYPTQRATYIRFIGMDVQSLRGGKTIVSLNGNDASHHYYIYGNYLHDAGVDARGETATDKAYALYLGGYGNYTDIYIGWNEMCYNSYGKGMQVYGHLNGDSIDRVYIFSNFIHHNSERGVALGGGDNGGGGTEYYYVKNLYFYNNIVASSDNALEIGGASLHTMGDGGHYFIYNNTLYNNGIALDILSYTEELVFNNNICHDARFFDHNAASGVTSGNKNIWYGGGTDYPTWDATVNSFKVNPLFIDAANNNFTLQSTSPCKGSGVNMSGTFTHDYMGKTRSTWDIGALLYDTGVPGDTTPPGPPSGVTTTIIY